MLGNFNDIISLFQEIKSQSKLNSDYCILFVYNSPKTMSDTYHSTECIFSEELHMILSSFSRIAEFVYSFDGEDEFINQIAQLKNKHKYIMVYSMAQNLTGSGRRSLIPLLCEYHHLINIGADFMSCTLGRSKEIMYTLLNSMGFPFPKTFFFKSFDTFEELPIEIQKGKWLLKPNNESSSIGMEVHSFDEYSTTEIQLILDEYHQKHPIFCIQEFINGEEVAVPMLKIKNSFYCPGISQVDFPEGVNYINYDMIQLETYGYFEYQGAIKQKLMTISADVAKQLALTGMSRIDFRICNDIPYIEDIGANPTISEANGVNQIYCDYLSSESWCIYAILVYATLINNGLFEPPFH